MSGECHLLSSYGDSISQTKAFTITNRIDAYPELSKKEFYPSENVAINVKAYGADGIPINEGFVEIEFTEAQIYLTKVIVNGSSSTE